MAIQNRRGLIADLDTTKMLAGEFAVPLDAKEVYVAFSSGDTKRMATWEDFNTEMTAVQEVTDRANASAEACENIVINRVGINDASTTSTTETWSANKLTSKFSTKADLVGGIVPSNQLPSYVDDVVEGYLYTGKFYKDSGHTQLITPENGKIYVDLVTNVGYRWSGSAYSAIGSSLSLGETSTTAYAGDKGKAVTDKVGNTTMTTTAQTVTGAINELNSGKLPSVAIGDIYSSSSTYAIGDRVIYNNQTYRCTTTISTPEAWNASHWTIFKVLDDLETNKWIDITSQCTWSGFLLTSYRYYVKVNPALRLMEITCLIEAGRANNAPIVTLPLAYRPAFTETYMVVAPNVYDIGVPMTITYLLKNTGELIGVHSVNHATAMGDYISTTFIY